MEKRQYEHGWRKNDWAEMMDDKILASYRADQALDCYATLAAVERAHICQVLMAAKWSKRMAARVLGIHRSSLYKKIKKHKIAAEVWRR